MWEEGFPWHNTQMSCMDDLNTRQKEVAPPAPSPAARRTEGGAGGMREARGGRRFDGLK